MTAAREEGRKKGRSTGATARRGEERPARLSRRLRGGGLDLSWEVLAPGRESALRIGYRDGSAGPAVGWIYVTVFDGRDHSPAGWAWARRASDGAHVSLSGAVLEEDARRAAEAAYREELEKSLERAEQVRREADRERREADREVEACRVLIAALDDLARAGRAGSGGAADLPGNAPG